jgi:hypothetical protein
MSRIHSDAPPVPSITVTGLASVIAMPDAIDFCVTTQAPVHERRDVADAKAEADAQRVVSAATQSVLLTLQGLAQSSEADYGRSTFNVNGARIVGARDRDGSSRGVMVVSDIYATIAIRNIGTSGQSDILRNEESRINMFVDAIQRAVMKQTKDAEAGEGGLLIQLGQFTTRRLNVDDLLNSLIPVAVKDALQTAQHTARSIGAAVVPASATIRAEDRHAARDVYAQHTGNVVMAAPERDEAPEYTRFAVAPNQYSIEVDVYFPLVTG